MQCVFDNPIHANGCIFADPASFIVETEIQTYHGGGGFRHHAPGRSREELKEKILRDDIDIVALVIAAIEAEIIE